MANNGEKERAMHLNAEDLLTTSKIGFKGEEMVKCRSCAKTNPPNRSKCFYCEAALDIPAGSARDVRINSRKLEAWELGFNVVLLPPVLEVDKNKISNFLNIETDHIQRMLSTQDPIPVLRLTDPNDARAAVEKLGTLGLHCLVVDDAFLKAADPHRIRRLEFEAENIKIEHFNSGEIISLPKEDMTLIVVGTISDSKTETVEKRQRKVSKLLQETTSSFDQPIMDIYFRDKYSGYRIYMNGFDFSCLVDDMELTAAANMETLKKQLLTCSTSIQLRDEFPNIRSLISTVWEPEISNDFLGVTRAGMGRTGFGKVARTNNLLQFTKYSRLQNHLLGNV